MATKQTNIFPIDQQPRNAVGLAYPFSTAFDQNQIASLNFNSSSIAGNSPFKLNYTTEDQIRSNLVIYFSTFRGERYLNPDYGGGLRDMIFEQINDNTLYNIEKLIRDELAINFPSVNLKAVEVSATPDEHEIVTSVSYTVFNNENINTIEINFSR